MTLVPFNECCLQLGVDPKTLRLWLKAAQFSCCLHPRDARLKCLTLAQLQQLAELHGRPLLSSWPDMAQEAGTPPACAPTADPGCSKPDTDDLHQQLSRLGQQVSTLQAQVAELALVLLRQSLALLPPTSAAPSLAPSVPAYTPAQAPVHRSAPVKASTPSPEPEPPRRRSRALPLIQVRTDGSVVVISPTEGVLPLVPDSPSWFAWLASLPSFSFQGQEGHFSASRKFRQGKPTQYWIVHRCFHGRSTTLYLGLTSALTLARLHQMTAIVQARLTAP